MQSQPRLNQINDHQIDDAIDKVLQMSGTGAVDGDRDSSDSEEGPCESLLENNVLKDGVNKERRSTKVPDRFIRGREPDRSRLDQMDTIFVSEHARNSDNEYEEDDDEDDDNDTNITDDDDEIPDEQEKVK